MNPKIGNGFEQYLTPNVGDIVMFADLETNKGYEDEYRIHSLSFDDDGDLITTLETDDGTLFDCYAHELAVKM